METKKKIDVIYILSEKSSGSSFLFRSLKDALSITSYPETQHFESETLFWTKAASLLNKPQLNMLASAVPYDKDKAREDLKFFLDTNLPAPVEFQSDEELVFDGWYELVKNFGPVFIEKSPHHLLQWSALCLMREFEQRFRDKVNCHYICIVRNPKDVFLSQFRRWNVDLKQLENQWLVTYMNWERFQQFAPSNVNQFFIRYEDLVSNRQYQISKICDAMGLQSQLECGEKVKKSKSFRQRDSFGYKFSPSIIYLSKSMGYTEEDLARSDSKSWLIYKMYIIFAFTPAKFLYRFLQSKLKSK
jgi:hypothetical protein